MPKIRRLHLKINVGDQFGLWTVIGKVFYVDTKPGRHATAKVACRCQCGNENPAVIAQLLLRGRSTSCGCTRLAKMIEASRVAHTIHGLAYSSLHGIWSNMKKRCYNPKDKRYADWGGRGIKVCEEWKDSFKAFAEWAIPAGYKKGLQIDRIDNMGDYSPQNCRWVTSQVNNRNRRDTVFLSAFGETKPLREWAEDPRCKVTVAALSLRIKRRGWDTERAITTPPMKSRYSFV